MVEKRFEKLGMPDIERFENYLPTAFNSELTLLQKVNKIIFDLIETNKLTNEMVDYLNQFIEKFDEKLYKTIDDVLSKWLEDGVLTELIRNTINEEVIEARTDYLDHTYLTLKERLDLEREEVILSRGGSQTLGERLDSDKAEVSVQMTHFDKKTKWVSIDSDMSVLEIQQAIDYAYTNNMIIRPSIGTYRISGDLILKTSITGYDKKKTIFLFDEGYGFTNFKLDGSAKYQVEFIENITFESDKTRFWNAINAREAYDVNVSSSYAKRVYGQRVYIGNKTTTPNCITPNANKEDPYGFWNKDYSQWTGDGGLDLNAIKNSTLYSQTDFNDTNILYGSHTRITNCAFIGFAVGLTLKGMINVVIDGVCLFERCRIGLLTVDASSMPGVLSVSEAKCTTITVEKSNFYDISFVGVFGDSLLQSKIVDNIMQPCKIGVILYTAAQNVIYGNYHEVSYIGTYIATNDATGNDIHGNFANALYVIYNVYAKFGKNNNIFSLKNNTKVFVHASVSNCDFDGSCELEISPSYFYVNGNSQERTKPKVNIITFTGVRGTSFSSTVKKSTRVNSVPLTFTGTQTGLMFSGNETILSVEYMTPISTPGYIGYYNPNTESNDEVIYLVKWDPTNKVYTSSDLRTDGVLNTLKITFLDGKI